MREWISEIIWAGAVVVWSLILQGDIWNFWCWWLAVEVLGFIALPLCARLFRNFDDRGWMFSKVLGIAGAGFLNWWLVSVKLMKFTTLNCLIVCGVLLLVSIAACIFCPSVRAEMKFAHKKLIFAEELLFLIMFILWTYLAGFNPQAFGTEKFMDYGFMENMMRSDVLPPRDLWYSEGVINYYYGGQYFAVFLTKISGLEVKVTYNLMRSFIAGIAFVLPFSLTYQMMKDRLAAVKKMGRSSAPAIAGVTAGAAVSLAGNMHYVVYCLGVYVKEFIQNVPPDEMSRYWFPDATRYIGYNPDVPDKTIHEFPSYSFILGDLHAHVVNILFVLLVLGILYAFFCQKRDEKIGTETGIRLYIKEMLNPHLITISILIGMFRWTNFWDFVIYFVVCGGVVLFTNMIRFQGDPERIVPVTFWQAVEVLVVSYVVILPFTLQFKSMVDGVAFAQYHSLWYQLLILWGLPVILTTVFLFTVLFEKLKKGGHKKLHTFMAEIEIPDLFAVILGLCAIGLVMIPELVYVRDIYEEGNARANTMFKLTYQAYIMFGITMGYVIYRLFLTARKWILKMISAVGLICLILTCGYFARSVDNWYGNVLNLRQYEGLDATAFIEYTFYEDNHGIQWLKENIKDTQVVLEANGDSYTEYNRVSAMTGLPTILGWYVHEWLWRSDPGDLNVKNSEIEEIYTSEDTERVHQLLDDYDVSYIFVGARENEKYGENLNHNLLRSMGNVVFEDEIYGTYIIQID